MENQDQEWMKIQQQKQLELQDVLR